MSHLLEGTRLVLAIPEVDPEIARQRIQMCSVGLDGKYSEEAFLACPSCQDLAERIKFREDMEREARPRKDCPDCNGSGTIRAYEGDEYTPEVCGCWMEHHEGFPSEREWARGIDCD